MLENTLEKQPSTDSSIEERDIGEATEISAMHFKNYSHSQFIRDENESAEANFFVFHFKNLSL